MIVVLVLMMSCQVSLNRKSGPVIAQPAMTRIARQKVAGRPLTCAAAFAKTLNQDLLFIRKALAVFGRLIDAVLPLFAENEPPVCRNRPVHYAARLRFY